MERKIIGKIIDNKGTMKCDLPQSICDKIQKALDEGNYEVKDQSIIIPYNEVII
jgi:hypothetical protein